MSAAVDVTSQAPDPEPMTPGDGDDGWLGVVGAQLRVRATVERVDRRPSGLVRYLLRDDETSSFLEWSSPRRYGITVGDRLHLSGVVHQHTEQDGRRLTVLHHCFNPMRLA